MIRLGIVVPVTEDLAGEVQAYADAGFEAVSPFIWEHAAVADLGETLSRARDAAAARGLEFSTLSVYGNPLRDDETGESVRGLWSRLVDEAERLEVPVVTGFAGRVAGAGVEAYVPAWREVFAPLADHADRHGVRLAFDNCRIGDTWKTGKWNIAINPDAWELMFDALDAPHLGLEWEPCHQLESLADPHAQLEAWAHRVFHVHGKDALVDRQALSARGFYSRAKWHRSVLPGQGESNWARLLGLLSASVYRGTVDVENTSIDGPDKAARRDEEIKSLSYLKLSRKATFAF